MPEVFDEQEVEAVINLRKWCDQDVEWKARDGYLEFRLAIVCEEAYPLQIIGVFTAKTGYYRYNFFLGSQPIRMLHVGKAHHNPECDRTGKNHKHRWTDAHQERWAYEPGDLDLSDMETAFRGFVQECNIEFRGQFRKPAIQMILF